VSRRNTAHSLRHTTALRVRSCPPCGIACRPCTAMPAVRCAARSRRP